MAVTEWFRYEIVATNKCTVSILIVPHLLACVGRAVSSCSTCGFAKRIYGAIYDKCVGDVRCRVFGYIHCQPGRLYDNSVVGDKFFTCFMHFYRLSASIKPIGFSINFKMFFLQFLFFRSSSSSSLSIWRNGTKYYAG